VATLFSDILAKGVRRGELPGRSQGSIEWYRKQAKTAAGKEITAETLLSTNDKGRVKARLSGSAFIGSMYFFEYDPKHKETLPYYDRFPLIFPINKAKGGFIGLNMHYLPPQLRARLMDALYDLATDDKYNERTKLALSYEILASASKFRLFAPCIKQYLNSHVRSRFIKIEASEWDIALFLPVQKFEKQSTSKVWADSRKMIQG
jgi:hypothetical protein|tara:strand:- start:3782 stop:4396 length:615 start_codon:yes stop_codon:yes gene_type:complete